MDKYIYNDKIENHLSGQNNNLPYCNDDAHASGKAKQKKPDISDTCPQADVSSSTEDQSLFPIPHLESLVKGTSTQSSFDVESQSNSTTNQSNSLLKKCLNKSLLESTNPNKDYYSAWAYNRFDRNMSILERVSFDQKNQKKKYCNNCGKIGHFHKTCPEPITSIGIFAVKLDIQDRFINNLIQYLKDEKKDILHSQNRGINIESLIDTNLFSIFKDNIKVLMIRRRFTLGFMEFIRGRYKLDNTICIITLFRQMIPEEIDLIINNNFNTLWNMLWNPAKPLNNENEKSNEYIVSEEKFNSLKKKDNSINIYNIIDNIKTVWKEPEWGFPKGRRNTHENNIKCAIREFREETNLTTDDYVLFDNLEPMEEVFYGTNGVKYRHIYYLALITTNKDIIISDTNKHQLQEIGNIGLFNYDNALNLIRPYHNDRHNIISTVFMFLIKSLILIYYKK